MYYHVIKYVLPVTTYNNSFIESIKMYKQNTYRDIDSHTSAFKTCGYKKNHPLVVEVEI
jgi:hypothetical protein